MVRRQRTESGRLALDLRSQPKDPREPDECREAAILRKFLSSVGRCRPRLVGYNSQGSDLAILVQRAIVNGIRAERFCSRPEKPWEGTDYFARTTDWHVDLMSVVSPYGNAAPSLNQIATLSGIPGKLGFDGGDIAQAWLDGKLERIVKYNEHDALTTYLVWLRTAHLAGHVSDAEYRDEQQQLRALSEIRFPCSEFCVLIIR